MSTRRKRCPEHCPCRVPQAHKWWEREPGYYAREEWPRERAKIGREWWPSLQEVYMPVYDSNHLQSVALRQAVAGCLREYVLPAQMTLAQRCAELAKQSRRLAGHEEND